MKTKLCGLCKKRRANQQEWKDDYQKEHCLICHSFLKFCDALKETLQILADRKSIPCIINITLENK